MGVLGLIPFLQKSYPKIIHKLPHRLGDLSGKKLVIDGTLITQRLHYAPSPHPFRHVLGWYQLAKEMKENSVSAVCVFDGRQRSQAKAEELGRRRETRRLDVSRGTLELSRTKRLQKLKTVMAGLHSLNDSGRNSVAEMLSRLNTRDGTGTVGAVEGLLRVGERLRVLQEAPLPIEPQTETLTPGDALVSGSAQPQDSKFMGLGLPAAVGYPIEESSLDDIKAGLLSSYRDFRSSISKVASLPLLEVSPKVSSSDLDSTVEEGATAVPEDLVLSKTQCELMLEEGKVWDELTLATTPAAAAATATPTVTIPPLPQKAEFAIDTFVLGAAEDRLDALALKSEVVANSYQRRMCVPTKSTYQESREILEAMGVLCYEIEGEAEAEALASSMVLNGLADYVVSEDSDVLAYEAPLIRNISSRSDPLVLIHGRDVRAALELSRDAYIDFVILLGTDFSQRIKNVGPSRAYKLIKEYGSIENIIASQTKYQPRASRAEYLAQVASARAIFHSLPPIPDRLRASMTEMQPTIDQTTVAVIMERCGLGKVLVADAYWDYEAGLAGNYFGDDPSTISW